jgi:xylose isomerase-like TIM barrel protein
MRPIGFSTGALAKGEFRRGLQLQSENSEITAVELSALRSHELGPLVDAIPSLDLDSFAYVSFHAPSKPEGLGERDVVDLLRQLPREWPIIAHPEILQTPELWAGFGSQLCLENMDNRKTTGRTVVEMRALFQLFPNASFCLDIGHARQIDPTMATALMMLTEFSERLVQIHVSEVGPRGEHLPVSRVGEIAFRKLAHRVRSDCPLIIESIVAQGEIANELTVARELFNGGAVRAIA